MNFAKAGEPHLYTGGPLLMQFFETLEKQQCKQKTAWRSDLVLVGQMRVPKKHVI